MPCSIWAIISTRAEAARGSRGARTIHGARFVTLEDYRRRYRQYRSDPDLQEVHRQHPFIAVWDDHEVANDSWRGGAQNHDDDEGDWRERRAAAHRAYFEWLPIREGKYGRIWRRFQFGDLVELLMLDTRSWGRDEKLSDWRTERDDLDRRLLGADQEAWLHTRLRRSEARWKLLGQQVMMAQLKGRGSTREEGESSFLNPDQWDGYRGTRDRLFDVLSEEGVDNVVVLTGDIHSSWANDLHPDPNNPEVYDGESSEGALAVEFITPAVTSGGFLGLGAFTRQIRAQNPHIRWIDFAHRGYVVVDVTPERVQGAWYHIEDLYSAQIEETFAAAFSVYAGQSGLVRDEEPAPPGPSRPAAPER